MNCPKCNKQCSCGCKSCKENITDLKRFKFIGENYIKCPNCECVLSIEKWEDYNYKL